VPFHVLIRRLRGQGDGRTIVFNQSEEWIEERIVSPWDRGEDIVLSGEHWSPRDIQITVRETTDQVAGSDSLTAWAESSALATDRTNDLLDRPAGNAAPNEVAAYAADRRKVMVVLGRNSAVGDSLFSLLRTIDLQPLEWTQLVGSANSGAPYIGEVLDAAFSQAQAVVVLSTPDDVAYLRHDLVPDGDPENEVVPRAQARPNVFYEAGMAMGRFPTRTIFVEAGTMRPASDLGGIHAVRMNEGPECRRDLAKRLEDAGCEVNTDGTQWLTAGTFSIAEPVTSKASEENSKKALLIQRIDAFLAELTSKLYASTIKGETFNELVEQSGVLGIRQATPLSMTSNCNLTETDMRMLLGQVKLRM
jgi:predicted nucleotide-binding protein